LDDNITAESKFCDHRGQLAGVLRGVALAVHEQASAAGQ
jgi:hypothetical protein